MKPRIGRFGSVLALLIALQSTSSHAQEMPLAQLQKAFADPPNAARPRVWWHWLNGNVTERGIVEDLQWMRRVGIGGVQMFDISLGSPRIVDQPLTFMTPGWKSALRVATTEAGRQGLEFGIASSPGFSETGGPWVAPADGLKKLVWAQMRVSAGAAGRVAAPRAIGVTGPYLDLPYHSKTAAISGAEAKPPPTYYQDVAVLAFPAKNVEELPSPTVMDGASKPFDAAALLDDRLDTKIEIPRGTPEAPAMVVLAYPHDVTVRSATLFIDGVKTMFSDATVKPVLEASSDGIVWRVVSDVPASEIPTTVSFRPVTARKFRIVLSSAPVSGTNFDNPAPGILPSPILEGMAAAAGAPFEVAQFKLSAQAMVDMFEAKAGYSVALDYNAMAAPDTARGVPPEQVLDLTGHLRPDGTLDWVPPSGNWTVLRIGATLVGTTNDPAAVEATGLEVDKYDAAAVRGYMNHYLDLYRDALGGDGRSAHPINALVSDSIEVGAANWTPQLLTAFRERRGYDPLPWLPALTGVIVGDRRRSDDFLYDWRLTLSELLAASHYGTIADVAHRDGLTVYSEALEAKRPSLGDDMAMRSHADVPMGAMWAYNREAGPKPTYVADLKGASSIAHLYGRRYAGAESMTSALQYWSYAPADMKPMMDEIFLTGANRPVIHASVHSPSDTKEPGLSLLAFGQFFNRHEAWADLAKPWVDYLARTALLLQTGDNVADVGYFYGEEGPLTALYAEHGPTDAPKRYAYDFINADALQHILSVDGQELRSTGGARYRALYLGGSSRRMTLTTLRRIAALADAGATIIGPAPTDSPSLADDAHVAEWQGIVRRLWSGAPSTVVGKGRVIANTNVEAALQLADVTPDVEIEGGRPDADIPFVHRRIGQTDIYFLVNRHNRPEAVRARFRAAGRVPRLWSAETGTIAPTSYRIDGHNTIVPLDLDAEEAVFVVFGDIAGEPALTISPDRLKARMSLDAGWTIAFQPGRGAPKATRMARLAPLNASSDQGIRYFSGIAAYSRDFKLPVNWQANTPLWLDLGMVGDVAEVSLNGKDIGGLWHSPYRIDVSAAAQPGRNNLTIRVANLWVNRLIGDAQPGATKVAWTQFPAYKSDAPLRPSGLIGPVRLLEQDRR